MCAQTSVSSLSTRHSALLAKPTLRPTASRPRALRRRTNSDSTAYAAPRSKLESRAEGGVTTVRPVEYAVNSSCARAWGSKKLAYLAVASSPTGTRPGAAARSAKISAAATSASSALP